MIAILNASYGGTFSNGVYTWDCGVFRLQHDTASGMWRRFLGNKSTGWHPTLQKAINSVRNVTIS